MRVNGAFDTLVCMHTYTISSLTLLPAKKSTIEIHVKKKKQGGIFMRNHEKNV